MWSNYILSLISLITRQTVFSTGLLVLQPILMNQLNIPLQMTTQFDATNYSTSIVGAAPAQRVYGFYHEQLPRPASTSENLVIQSFDLSSGPLDTPGSSYTGVVPGFSTEVECENIPVDNKTSHTYLPWWSIQAPFFLTNITTDTCNITNIIVGEGADHGFYFNNNATQTHLAYFRNVTCNTGGDDSQIYQFDNGTDHRFLMSVALLKWLPHPPEFESNWTWVEDLTVVLCKPSYSIDNYTVTYTQHDETPSVQSVKIPGTNSSLEGFDDVDLTMAVQTTLGNSSFGSGGADFVLFPVDTFYLLMEAMNNNSDLQPFMDPDLLMDLGSRAYKELSTQVAFQYLVDSRNITIIGSTWQTEDRLQVKQLTVGLMAACLGILVCIAIYIVFAHPKDTVPCDPEATSSQAAILAASQSVRQRLSQTGSATSDQIAQRLAHEKFQTTIGNDSNQLFTIERAPDTSEKARRSSQGLLSSAAIRWWRPLALRNWYTVLLLAIPVILIIVLEVLQRVFDRHQGLLEIDSTSNSAHILSTYLPAFAMVGVAALYTSFNFNVSVFAPFAALRRGNAAAKQSVMINLIGKLPPHALFVALRSGSLAACLTLLAGFVSSFLTIVVSGLYSPGPVLSIQNVTVQQTDNFNFTHIDISLDDGAAATITNLIMYSNLSYPQWTSDNLALPSMVMTSSVQGPTNASQTASMYATVPAFRAALDCSPVLPRYIQSIKSSGAGPHCENCNDIVEYDYLMALPWSLCAGGITNQTNATWLQRYVTPNDSSTVYAGHGTDLLWSVEGGISGDGGMQAQTEIGSATSLDTQYTDNTLPTCPSVSFSLGTTNAGRKTNVTVDGDGVIWKSHTNITLMYCYQRIERVMTNVTYTYPGFTITSALPLEDTVQNMTSPNKTIKGDYWFDLSVNALMNSLQLNDGSIVGRNDLNSFMQALVWGKDGIPLDELYNHGNTSVVTAAANRLYGRYMAQVLSQNMRTTVADPNQPLTTFPATLTRSTERLQQNRNPKIALQTMLAFMVLCALGVWLLFARDVREVLPHNPCSIAGTMSLLADSDVVKGRGYIREGAEWSRHVALKHEKGWDDLRLRMGWQGDGGKGDRFTIDVDEDRMIR